MTFNIKSLLLILFITVSPLCALTISNSASVDIAAHDGSAVERDSSVLVARSGTPAADGQINCIFTGIPDACWLRSSQNPSHGAGFTVFDSACNTLGTGMGTVGVHASVDSELRWSVEVDWINNDWARTPIGQYAGSSWGLPVENNICLGYEYTHGAYTSCLIPFNCRDPTASVNKARDPPVTIEAQNTTDSTALVSRQINTHPGQEDPNGAISCFGTPLHQCLFQITQEESTQHATVVLYSSFCDELNAARLPMVDTLYGRSIWLPYSFEINWPFLYQSYAMYPIIRYNGQTITFPAGGGCVDGNAGIWNGQYTSCLYQFQCTW